MLRKIALVATTVLALGALSAGIALAAGGGGSGDGYSETETPIVGEAFDRASAAALDHVGGGTVTETEVEDQESYYEVEVTLDDGSQVDVQLDEDFKVVGSEDDHEGPDDDMDGHES